MINLKAYYGPDGEYNGLTRRQLLKMMAAGAGTMSFAALLAACGDDDDDDDTPDVPATTDDDTDDESMDVDDEEDDDALADEPADDDGGEFVIAQGPEITSLDGSMTTGMLTFNVVQHFMEPLVHRSDDFSLEPFLATELDQIDDVTMRVTLRDGVVFHNGDPLTVDDVVYSFERMADPDTGSDLLRYVRTLESATAVDDQTVDLTLTEPDATFGLRLTLLPIVPQAVVEELGDPEFDQNPMGTGPYRFVEWRRGERVTIERFDDYWGEPARNQRLHFRGIPEDATRVAELQTGAVDIITNVPNHVVPEIEQADGIQIKAVNSLRTLFALLNSHKEPFNDVRMRQAANYAVDVQLIVDEMLDGFGQPTSQPWGPEVFGFHPGYDDFYAYDPDRARELMEEAGYGDGVEINFVSPSGRYLRDVEVSQNIAAQLEEVGFTVNLNLLEFQAFMDNFINIHPEPNPDLDIALFSNANNTADADYNLTLNVHSQNRGTYWVNTEVDDLIDQARQVFDQDERLALYHQIVEIMVEEAAWLYLYTSHDIYGVSDRAADWEPRADEMIYLPRVAVRG
jgi:peptide/nickel transport system substrate-binding protein